MYLLNKEKFKSNKIKKNIDLTISNKFLLYFFNVIQKPLEI